MLVGVEETWPGMRQKLLFCGICRQVGVPDVSQQAQTNSTPQIRLDCADTLSIWDLLRGKL
jgi:hypothetical protein